MPTYEYGCTICGNEWEQVQRITEAPVDVCPKCGKAGAHRLISAGTNFILKGGGWYSDLYSSSKAPANKMETNGTTSTDAGVKSDTKSEPVKSEPAKAETKASPVPAATGSAT